jgi:type I restriction-modification system DNA methylase subunit
MAPSTKEGQRAELHKTIWRIANDLRGSVDGWDFKTYVLGMLFYRFISENLTAYVNRGEHEAGEAGFDYPLLPDGQAEVARAELVAEKGFFIYPSELFQNVRERAPGDANLSETLERAFKNIEGSAVGTDSEDDLKGLFDDLDVNSSKLGNTVARRNEKLVKLLGAIQQHVVDAFTARVDVDNVAKLVPGGNIAANDYNIAVSSYVEQKDTREVVDIQALNAEIGRIVARQAELRTSIDAIVADLEGGAA